MANKFNWTPKRTGDFEEAVVHFAEVVEEARERYGEAFMEPLITSKISRYVNDVSGEDETGKPHYAYGITDYNDYRRLLRMFKNAKPEDFVVDSSSGVEMTKFDVKLGKRIKARDIKETQNMIDQLNRHKAELEKLHRENPTEGYGVEALKINTKIKAQQAHIDYLKEQGDTANSEAAKVARAFWRSSQSAKNYKMFVLKQNFIKAVKQEFSDSDNIVAKVQSMNDYDFALWYYNNEELNIGWIYTAEQEAEAKSKIEAALPGGE